MDEFKILKKPHLTMSMKMKEQKQIRNSAEGKRKSVQKQNPRVEQATHAVQHLRK